jgi:hypothetical protein
MADALAGAIAAASAKIDARSTSDIPSIYPANG